MAKNEGIDIDLEQMDTHIVNAVLTGLKSKSSLTESILCNSKIIPEELDKDCSSSSTLDWVKLQRTDPNLSVIIKLIESDQLFKRKLHKKDSPEVKALLRIKKFEINQTFYTERVIQTTVPQRKSFDN